MKTISTKIDTGIQTYTFTDTDDHVFASFRVNPTDANLAARAQEVGDFIQKMGTLENVRDWAEMNRLIEEKVSYVLGYDASEVFGEVTATTIFPDGNMFAALVVDKIIDAVTPALEQRKANMQKAADKYLSKYKS